MKVNMERTIIINEQEVDIFLGKDENGCVQFIDFVGYCCDECEKPHTLQRFALISEDELSEALQKEDENDWDDHICGDGEFDLEKCVGCTNYDMCVADTLDITE